MSAKRRLLVAVTELGYVHARRALQDSFDLVPAFSIPQALASVKHSGIQAVLVSLHFDDSRMFDFVHQALALAPALPIVCCRILHTPLTPRVLAGLRDAVHAQGCRDFIDYNELQRQHGFPEADRRFREELLRLLSADEPPQPLIAPSSLRPR